MKFIGKLLLSILILFVLAITIVLATFNPNSYIEEFTHLVDKNTGYQLEIDSIDWQVKQPFKLDINGVNLKFQHMQLASFSRIGLTLNSISPFSRDVRIRELVLFAPKINLNPKLIAAFTEEYGQTSPPTDSAAGNKPLLIERLSLDSFRLDKLEFQLDSKQTPVKINDLDLAISQWRIIDHGQVNPGSWELIARLDAALVSLPNVELKNLVLESRLHELNYLIDNLTFDVMQGQVYALGSLTLERRPKVTISDLTLDNIKLELLEEWLSPQDQTAAIQNDSTVTKPLPIDELNIESFRLRNFNLTSYAKTLPISLNKVDFSLTNATLIKDGQMISSPPQWQQQAQFQLNADQLVYGEYVINQPQLEGLLENELLSISNLYGEAFKGKFSGRVSLALNEKPDITLENLRLINLDIPINQQWFDSPESEVKQEKETKTDKKSAINSLTIKKLDIENLSLLSYADQLPLSIRGLDLLLTDAELIKKAELLTIPPKWEQNAKFSLTIEESIYQGFKASKTKVSGSLDKNDLTLSKLKSLLPGGELNSKATIKLTPELPARLDARVSNIQLDKLNLLLDNQKFPLAGQFSTTSHLTTKLIDKETAIKNLAGTLELSSTDISIQNLDLDLVLKNYLNSQKTGLLDVAGLVALGPAGLLISQASSLGAGVIGVGNGITQIDNLKVGFDIDQGIAHFTPSALTTVEHHIAFNGALDLVNQRFEQFDTGILNDKGCAELIRSVSGDFSKPRIELASTIFGSVLNPIKDVFGAARQITKGNCKVFYTGPVTYPAKGRTGIITIIGGPSLMPKSQAATQGG